MNLKQDLASLFCFITLPFLIPSSALVAIGTEELGTRLCWQIPQNFSACTSVEFYQQRLLQPGSYPNITSPRIIITAKNKGSTFNFKFKNGSLVHSAKLLLVKGEGTEVDIELLDISTSYKIQCWSFGPILKLSTNIIMSSKIASRVARSASRVPIWTYSLVTISGNELQSGYVTCRSVDHCNNAETFRVFTQLTAQNETQESSPFVPLPGRAIIQDDGTSSEFILPCRTNYRMENPPYLLWKKHDEENLTMLTAEEIKDFGWDPRVGFQFNSSYKMWEMETLTCRWDSFEKTFRPTSARFMMAIFVRAEKGQIGCGFARSNDSSNILAYDLINQKTRYQECNSYIECEVLLESGTLLHDSWHGILPKNSTFDSTKKHGILSCYVEHVYKGKHVPAVSSSMYFIGLDSNVYIFPGTYPNSSAIQISQVDGPFYKDHKKLSHKFTCKTIKFVEASAVYFILRYQNLSEKFVGSENSHGFHSDHTTENEFKVKLNTNITHAICFCLTQDGKVLYAERPLQILDVFELVVDNSTTKTRTFKVGELNAYLTLTCPITAVRQPTYQWTFDEKNENLAFGMNTQNLTFRQIHENMAGSYTCQAWNQYHNSSFEFQVSIQPQEISSVLSSTTKGLIASGALLSGTLLVFIVILAIKYFKTKRQIRDLTPEEALEFFNGVPNSNEGPYAEGTELALHLPFTKCIESTILNVARDSILGKGEHGIVYLGFLNVEAVAVKTFKRAVTYDEFRARLLEVKLLNFLDKHPNIVRFIGADVTNIEKRDILIVMELSPFGSLETYLRALKPANQTNYVSTAKPKYANVDERLTLGKLFGFCEQIAFAMEYLERKRVIHGDVAARNVLVFNHGVVKVTDFGYSRQILENDTYKPKKNRALPWRWASIELLRQMEFSTESDIWAFGVTAWEILTFGNVPFASEKWNEEFMISLENGLRLKKPSGLSESQYSFLMECWNVNKSTRPRFASLKDFFLMEKSLRLHLETAR